MEKEMPKGYKAIKWADVEDLQHVWIAGRNQGEAKAYGPHLVVNREKRELVSANSKGFLHLQEDLCVPEVFNPVFDVYYWKDPTFMSYTMFKDRAEEMSRSQLPVGVEPGSKFVFDLAKTHVFVARRHTGDKEAIYHNMQGEVWSPNGEARDLIRALGLHHTSMSMGDVLVDVLTGDKWIVASVGFERIR